MKLKSEVQIAKTNRDLLISDSDEDFDKIKEEVRRYLTYTQEGTLKINRKSGGL